MPKSSNKLSGQQLYDVERILDKKLDNGVIKYLVKWSGYSTDDSNQIFLYFFSVN